MEYQFAISHVTDKVVDYPLKQAAIYYTQYSESQVYPLEGKPFYALYSYKWAGLDPKTGDPQGYLNGQVSKDYTAMLAAATPDNLVYEGSARPTTFGSIRNTFAYKQFSVSANISYRLGYYFRNNGVSFYNILRGQGYYYGNYDKRWQNPGDEATTTVPSLPASRNLNRDNFYNYSEPTVEKGDNIRLQDVSIGYTLGKQQFPQLPFSSIHFYLYANNLGIIWKATKSGLDPDYPSAAYPPVRTLSAGMKVDF